MENIILNGQNLTIEILNEIVTTNKKVKISDEAMERLKKGRKMIFDLVDSEVPVYGFNTGVGWNKDKKIFKDFFNTYNTNLIYSHSLGVGSYCTEEEIRAILAARLNSLLVGCTGISIEIAQMYEDFLNHRIHPVIPKKGSVGQGDITNLSHVGLAMIGEGEVFFNGSIIDAEAALKAAGLNKAVLGPKDGLAIVSSNAFSAGKAALILKEIEDLLNISDVIYALSLEGLNGNISPLDPAAHRVRPYNGQKESLKNVRNSLKGSYIHTPDSKRALQDPLSFRGAFHVNGAVRDILKFAKDQLTIQLNSSDDNPCLVMDENKLISCSNFEPISWVLAFETLAIALSHMSKNSCNRIIRLDDPDFTGLPRFLSPNDDVLGFATFQKSFTALDTEIRHLSNPATSDFFSMAGDIEDHASNAPYVVDKLIKIVDLLYYITGIEAIHAAQAIDLRGDVVLGEITKKAKDMIRERVSFYDKDRPIFRDIQLAYETLKGKGILKYL